MANPKKKYMKNGFVILKIIINDSVSGKVWSQGTGKRRPRARRKPWYTGVYYQENKEKNHGRSYLERSALV